TYLGFHWVDGGITKYYVYNCLPFGISTAGYIFTKVLRVVLEYWRSQGHKVLMFLDDGVGGHTNQSLASHLSIFVRNSLLTLGFLISEEKSSWDPSLKSTWMGHVWHMQEGILTITDERVDRIETCIDSLFREMENNHLELVKVRFLASVVGQIISTQSVAGNSVQLMCRELFKCLLSRASWNSLVILSASAADELKYWRHNVRQMNARGKSISADTRGELAVFPRTEVLGTWSQSERAKSSTWREAEAVSRVLSGIANSIRGHKVKLFCDNRNVISLLQRGSNKPDLQTISLAVQKFCTETEVSILPTWIPRELNSEADRLSRCSDCDDWSIREWVFKFLDKSWGPHSIDRFSNNLNSKCLKFNSKWWVPGTAGVNALDQTWSNDCNWVVPPPALLALVVRKIISDHASCTLIIPEWKSSAFWPMLVDEFGQFKAFLDRVGITDVESSILARTISSYLLQSKSDSTVKKYYSSFLKWKNFCESSGYQPLPAEPIHVVLYLSTLLDSPDDISFHVISSVVYGIKWAHRLNALADPTENSLVVNMLEAAKRLRSKPTVKKDAIPSTLLVQLCNNFQDSSDLIVVRDLAMILLAFSGFLRFNELSALKCKDLSFRSEYMRIRISKSKTDQYRKGDEVLISKGCTSACPYVMLQKYIHI
ncbi:hypothetical protein ScPMuIL_000567, partial [Solemya velum]